MQDFFLRIFYQNSLAGCIKCSHLTEITYFSVSISPAWNYTKSSENLGRIPYLYHGRFPLWEHFICTSVRSPNSSLFLCLLFFQNSCQSLVENEIHWEHTAIASIQGILQIDSAGKAASVKITSKITHKSQLSSFMANDLWNISLLLI